MAQYLRCQFMSFSASLGSTRPLGQLARACSSARRQATIWGTISNGLLFVAARLTSSRCNETDKFLLVYVILKLKLIKGKCILFVNEVDRCYRLKLFLEQFSIKSCVLNSELPLNSR